MAIPCCWLALLACSRKYILAEYFSSQPLPVLLPLFRFPISIEGIDFRRIPFIIYSSRSPPPQSAPVAAPSVGGVAANVGILNAGVAAARSAGRLSVATYFSPPLARLTVRTAVTSHLSVPSILARKKGLQAYLSCLAFS